MDKHKSSGLSSHSTPGCILQLPGCVYLNNSVVHLPLFISSSQPVPLYFQQQLLLLVLVPFAVRAWPQASQILP